MIRTEAKMGEEKLKPLARAYHWTSEEHASDIQFGHNIILFEPPGIITVNEPGITPTRTIEYRNRELRTVDRVGPYSFAFLGSPYPTQWKEQPEMYFALLRK